MNGVCDCCHKTKCTCEHASKQYSDTLQARFDFIDSQTGPIEIKELSKIIIKDAPHLHHRSDKIDIFTNTDYFNSHDYYYGTAKMMPYICHLTKLVVLVLESQNLTEFPSLIDLTQLECLVLNNNRLTVFPQELLDMKHLTEIHIQCNNIEHFDYSESQTRHLNYFGIEFNPIKTMTLSMRRFLWRKSHGIYLHFRSKTVDDYSTSEKCFNFNWIEISDKHYALVKLNTHNDQSDNCGYSIWVNTTKELITNMLNRMTQQKQLLIYDTKFRIDIDNYYERDDITNTNYRSIMTSLFGDIKHKYSAQMRANLTSHLKDLHDYRNRDGYLEELGYFN